MYIFEQQFIDDDDFQYDSGLSFSCSRETHATGVQILKLYICSWKKFNVSLIFINIPEWNVRYQS